MLVASLPSLAATPDLGQLLTEQLTQKIVQFWRGTNLPSRNYANLLGNLLGPEIV